MSKLTIASASLAIALSVLFLVTVHLGLAAPAAAPVEVCTWPGCKSAAVSYTQDDASNIGENITSCRPYLDVVGFRGTFFYDGIEPQAWMADYASAGHEVGSHLAVHLNNNSAPSCHPNCTLAGLRETPYSQSLVDDFRQEQIDLSVLAIESETGQPVLSMAYPYGATDANRMAASEQYFLGARGYLNFEVANFPWITEVNAATPPDAMLINSHDSSYIALVEQAISEQKWAVLTMHDYCFGIGEGGTYLADHRDSLWVAPMGEVLKHIKVRDAFRFGNYIQTYNSISFDAGHSLSTMTRQTYTGTALLPIVFDNPVTLNADVPINNGVGGVLVDGLPVSYAVTGTITGTHGVLFTTTLGITRHVAITLTGPNAIQLQDITVRSDAGPGDNLEWLLAMIALGIAGLVGLMTTYRREHRR
jgi:peptidoglycan/xylan/chitin deacetylase (PgdA/CDA1 family)